MRERLGDILIKAGLLDKAGLTRALEEQERWGGQLGQYLVQMELITEETLVRALSTQFKLPAVALDAPRLDHAVAKRIPQEICERNRLICFRAGPERNFLDVAMADPASLDAIDEVRMATRCNVRPFFATPSSIDGAIRVVFYGDADPASAIDLSPKSAMRTDPHAYRERTMTGPKPLEPEKPAVTPAGPPQGNGRSADMRALEAMKPMLVDVDMKRQQPVRIRPAPAGPTPASVPPKPVAVPPPPPSLPGKAPVSLPDPKPEQYITDEHFHISMEMPDISAIDASEVNLDDLARRVKRLEATVARNSKLLQLLLGMMVQNGGATPQQVAQLLKEL